MTWNTPLGHRTLQGSEGKIIFAATNAMACEIIHDIDDSLALGIKVFDSMSGCQQLVMIDYVRHHLLEETSESAGMTAVIEGTAGCSATTRIPLRVASTVGATEIRLMEERAKTTLSGAK